MPFDTSYTYFKHTFLLFRAHFYNLWNFADDLSRCSSVEGSKVSAFHNGRYGKENNLVNTDTVSSHQTQSCTMVEVEPNQ